MNQDILTHFFEAYFHQDWRDDYGSSLKAVEDFCRCEPENKEMLAISIKQDLEKSPLSEKYVNEHKGNFDPRREGYSVEEWLGMVLDLLK